MDRAANSCRDINSTCLWCVLWALLCTHEQSVIQRGKTCFRQPAVNYVLRPPAGVFPFKLNTSPIAE